MIRRAGVGGFQSTCKPRDRQRLALSRPRPPSSLAAGCSSPGPDLAGDVCKKADSLRCPFGHHRGSVQERHQHVARSDAGRGAIRRGDRVPRLPRHDRLRPPSTPASSASCRGPPPAPPGAAAPRSGAGGSAGGRDGSATGGTGGSGARRQRRRHAPVTAAAAAGTTIGGSTGRVARSPGAAAAPAAAEAARRAAPRATAGNGHRRQRGRKRRDRRRLRDARVDDLRRRTPTGCRDTVTKVTSGTADLTVDKNTTYQRWDGFGGCFNEMGWDALSVLTADQVASAMKLLFDPTDRRGLRLRPRARWAPATTP